MKRTLQLQLDITANHIADLVGQLTGGEKPETESFIRKVRTLLHKLPGTAEMIRMDGNIIHVTWVPQGDETHLPIIANLLESGQYVQAVFLMELLLSSDIAEPGLLYNLGMAYSDMGKLERAQQLLEQLLEIDPENTNGRVAYGVALMRSGDSLTAEEQLHIAVNQDPTNPWANRNLGGVLLKLDRPADAVPYLRQAAEQNPKDERAWFGLGQALELAGDLTEADAAYVTALEINEFGDLAEQVRQARSQIAQKSFRSATPDSERMDAMMYCLGAMERFENMQQAQIQQIGFEIAILGTRGIDVNDPAPKYTLRSLPGNFSGLNLVSIQYVAFKIIAPEQNIGFDLSKEYGTAQALYQQRKK